MSPNSLKQATKEINSSKSVDIFGNYSVDKFISQEVWLSTFSNFFQVWLDWLTCYLKESWFGWPFTWKKADWLTYYLKESWSQCDAFVVLYVDIANPDWFCFSESTGPNRRSVVNIVIIFAPCVPQLSIDK